MPSAKPIKDEIDELRDRRGIQYAEPDPPHFGQLYESCRAAAEEGYVSTARAIRLLQQLQSDAAIAAIYPNNVLVELLREATQPGGWSSNVEHDLLHVLFALYLGYENSEPNDSRIRYPILMGAGSVVVSKESGSYGPTPPWDLSLVLTYSQLKSKAWQRALLSGHIDQPSQPVELRDKFVGFTGKFRFGTREACFNAARRVGAVPCDPTPYLDYLFISEEFEQQGALSSKLSAGIYYRRQYGRPLILSERAWEGCAVVS